MDSVYPVLNRFKGKSKTRRRWPKPPSYQLLISILLAAFSGSVYQPDPKKMEISFDSFDPASILIWSLIGLLPAISTIFCSQKQKDEMMNGELIYFSVWLLIRIVKDLVVTGHILSFSNLIPFGLFYVLPFFGTWFVAEWYFTSRK